MFVLNEETKQRFREIREESERLGISREEMNGMNAQAMQVLVSVNEYVDGLGTICESYPFIEALLADTVTVARDRLSYAYRLLNNTGIDEDDPNKFKEDRKTLLDLIKDGNMIQKKG